MASVRSAATRGAAAADTEASGDVGSGRRVGRADQPLALVGELLERALEALPRDQLDFLVVRPGELRRARAVRLPRRPRALVELLELAAGVVVGCECGHR